MPYRLHNYSDTMTPMVFERYEGYFSPSVNITRDKERVIGYIPTENAVRILDLLEKNISQGIRCFTVIGSYGTGKSAFIVALQQTLSGKHDHFPHINSSLKATPGQFLSVVGSYSSVEITLFKQLSKGKETNIWQVLTRIGKESKKAGAQTYIILDEFGKFLEYAGGNNPEKELYFVQQLAEFAADPANNIVIIATLHQGFESYSRRLVREQQHEWEKVRGRFKEITFNEPVEQLLNIASAWLRNKKENTQRTATEHISQLSRSSYLFTFNEEFIGYIALDLFPFDPISAPLLALALKKYGQNERSLFSFLESTEYKGINDEKLTLPFFYNLEHVYDYLSFNYSTYLFSRDNSDYLQWRGIRRSIERIEGEDIQNIRIAVSLVKVIGLLSIFAAASAKIHRQFLLGYLWNAFGDNPIDTEKVIDVLEKKKIIKFTSFKSQYVLFDGTDVDIGFHLQDVENRTESITDVVAELNYNFAFPPIPAKRSYFERGTPRYFQFIISKEPTTDIPVGDIDGFINLIFGDLSDEKIARFSKQCTDAIVFAHYKKADNISDVLFEIRKIETLLKDTLIDDDRVAKAELKEYLEFYRMRLEVEVRSEMFEPNAVAWFWKGEKVNIDSYDALSKMLSAVCQHVYSATPILRNELINRSKLSSPIHTARNNFIMQMVANSDKADWGFEHDKFPPQKTIYLALVKQTGIHREIDGELTLGEPTEPTLKYIWEVCEQFLKEAVVTRKGLGDLLERLESKPMKLKRGVIDFLLPLFLFTKRTEYALYESGMLVPAITSEALDLIVKSPANFSVKTFDISGLKVDLHQKYRQFLNMPDGGQSGIVDLFRPLVRFYRDLSEYAKTTKRISASARKLRDCIAAATDPEKALFVDFPTALGYDDFDVRAHADYLDEYVEQLRRAIAEIRDCYSELIEGLEAHIKDALGDKERVFPDYKETIRKRFSGLKTYRLAQHQKIFYNRLHSQLDEREPWISGVVQAVLHKSAAAMRDEDEAMVKERISDALRELDSLTELSQADFDETKEDIIKIEVTTFEHESSKQMVRLPKDKAAHVEEIKEGLKQLLSVDDKASNIAALLRLLKEML